MPALPPSWVRQVCYSIDVDGFGTGPIATFRLEPWTVVPEPATAEMIALGLVALATLRRRR